MEIFVRIEWLALALIEIQGRLHLPRFVLDGFQSTRAPAMLIVLRDHFNGGLYLGRVIEPDDVPADDRLYTTVIETRTHLR